MFSQAEVEKCKILVLGLGKSRVVCLCWQKRYFAELDMGCYNEIQFVSEWHKKVNQKCDEEHVDQLDVWWCNMIWRCKTGRFELQTYRVLDL